MRSEILSIKNGKTYKGFSDETQILLGRDAGDDDTCWFVTWIQEKPEESIATYASTWRAQCTQSESHAILKSAIAALTPDDAHRLRSRSSTFLRGHLLKGPTGEEGRHCGHCL